MERSVFLADVVAWWRRGLSRRETAARMGLRETTLSRRLTRIRALFPGWKALNFRIPPEMRGEVRLPEFGAIEPDEADSEPVTPGRLERAVAILRKQEAVKLAELASQLGLEGPQDAAELCEALRDQGQPIQVAGVWALWNPDVHADTPERPLWEGRSRFVFAAVADTHFGSRAQQPTALRAFLEEAAGRYGVTEVLHSGDLIAGVGGFRGWAQTVFAASVTEQINVADACLPRDLGLRYWVLGGNHDAWTVRDGGANPIVTLAARREDVRFLGWDAADVPLTPEVTARLWHPSGGVPYALSYRGQRYMQALAQNELEREVWGGSRPGQHTRFVFAGHLHVSAYFTQATIHYFQVPCWEGHTDYLTRKGLSPVVGGWIIEVECDGPHIRTVTPRLYTYEPRERDWGPRVTVVESDAPTEPLFGSK